jgi:hypothetical protein
MSGYLLGQGANLALILFALTALAVVGISLLLYRIAYAIKQRRATRYADAGEGLPTDDEVAPVYLVGAHLAEGTAKLEMQLTDANRALFMVLMDCCNIITEVGEGSPVAKSDAFNYATNIQRSGRTAMSNDEIADHSYQLAAELRLFSDPAMTAIRRLLMQLAFAGRSDAALDAEFDRAAAAETWSGVSLPPELVPDGQGRAATGAGQPLDSTHEQAPKTMLSGAARDAVERPETPA